MTDYITGPRDTYNIGTSRQVIDMADSILLLQPNAYPFTALSQKLAKSSCFNPKYEWKEDNILPWTTKINLPAGYSSSATSIVVDEGELFGYGTGLTTLVKVPRTGEVFRVTAVSTNTLTIVRGIGSTAAAALLNDDDLIILALVAEEGTGAPSAITTKEVDKYNYTMIIKTAVEGTGTEEATKLYGGPDRAYHRKKKAIEHMMSIERNLWFGERSLVTTGTHPKRSTGGIFEYLGANFVRIDSGMLTEIEFENWMRDLFKYGSPIKWAFCSPLAISIINMWASSRMQIVPSDKTFGMSITKLISPHGELNLVKQPLFEGDVYGGYIVALDFEDKCVELKVLRDTKLEIDVQANDLDGYKDQYVTEIGLKLAQVDRHGVLYNIKS